MYCSQSQREGFSLQKKKKVKSGYWQFHLLKYVLSTVVFVYTKKVTAHIINLH